MTQEEFIQILDKKGYSYELEGDRIIVTHDDAFFLDSVTSIPSGVVFKNRGVVNLSSLSSISPDVEFRNKSDIALESLTSIPRGLEFNNAGDVYLGLLIGRWFDEWTGNIEGIDSKILLNVMIKQGVFI